MGETSKAAEATRGAGCVGCYKKHIGNPALESQCKHFCHKRAAKLEPRPDFRVENHGSLFILYAVTEAAHEWVIEFLPDDRLTWGEHGTVVEYRYISDIINGIQGDGLTVAEG